MAAKKSPPKPVHVEMGAVSKVYDKKKFTKALIGKYLTPAAEKVVNKSSKLTTKVKNQKDEGFHVILAVESITKEREGRKAMVDARIRITGSTWPKKSMFAFATGGAKASAPDPKKEAGAAQDALLAGVEELMKSKIVPALEARA